MMKRFIILAITAAAVLAGGVAYASIPDSGGVIHACHKTPVPVHGAPLSVIDSEAGGKCPAGSVALTWNQTGPPGPAGATGPQGPAGVSGYSVALCTVSEDSSGNLVVSSSSG